MHGVRCTVISQQQIYHDQRYKTVNLNVNDIQNIQLKSDQFIRKLPYLICIARWILKFESFWHCHLIHLFMQTNKQTNDSNDIYLFKYFSYLLWFTAIRTVLVVNGHQNIWFYIYGSVQWKWQIGTCFANHCFLVSNTVCISHVTIIFVFLYWMEFF